MNKPLKYRPNDFQDTAQNIESAIAFLHENDKEDEADIFERWYETGRIWIVPQDWIILIRVQGTKLEDCHRHGTELDDSQVAQALKVPPQIIPTLKRSHFLAYVTPNGKLCFAKELFEDGIKFWDKDEDFGKIMRVAAVYVHENVHIGQLPHWWYLNERARAQQQIEEDTLEIRAYPEGILFLNKLVLDLLNQFDKDEDERILGSIKDTVRCLNDTLTAFTSLNLFGCRDEFIVKEFIDYNGHDRERYELIRRIRTSQQGSMRRKDLLKQFKLTTLDRKKMETLRQMVGAYANLDNDGKIFFEETPNMKDAMRWLLECLDAAKEQNYCLELHIYPDVTKFQPFTLAYRLYYDSGFLIKIEPAKNADDVKVDKVVFIKESTLEKLSSRNTAKISSEIKISKANSPRIIYEGWPPAAPIPIETLVSISFKAANANLASVVYRINGKKIKNEDLPMPTPSILFQPAGPDGDVVSFHISNSIAGNLLIEIVLKDRTGKEGVPFVVNLIFQ